MHKTAAKRVNAQRQISDASSRTHSSRHCNGSRRSGFWGCLEASARNRREPDNRYQQFGISMSLPPLEQSCRVRPDASARKPLSAAGATVEAAWNRRSKTPEDLTPNRASKYRIADSVGCSVGCVSCGGLMVRSGGEILKQVCEGKKWTRRTFREALMNASSCSRRKRTRQSSLKSAL